MHLLKLGLLALAAERAYGYLDSSPFFMFSTSELRTSNSQLRSATSLTSDISRILSQCLSSVYIVVNQPGVRASDYSSAKTSPLLSNYMTAGEKTSVRSSVGITEVVGDLDTKIWEEILQQKCGAQVTNVDGKTGFFPVIDKSARTLLNVDLPNPASEPRTQSLLDNDAFLASIIDTLPSQNYTVLYTTTSRLSKGRLSTQDANQYEMESPRIDAVHLDLKRDAKHQRRESDGNSTLVDGPLFERYQFLSPGIFMGLLSGLLLLLILYYAVAGVASLQVSYAAFDKEAGQLAQKKGQ